MIGKCANPNCSKPFRYLNDGRLFVQGPAGRRHRYSNRRDNRVSYAWLCQDCAAVWTVKVEAERGFCVVPLESSAEKRSVSPASVSVFAGEVR